MSFFKHDNGDIVFSKLPYTFQRRLIYLASEQDKFDYYDSVYITDNHYAYSPAVKAVRKERDYDCIQYLADGPLTISPTWQSVLLVNDILQKHKPLFIRDTLILHLKYTSYNKLTSQLFGSYTKLILYGHFTWDQIKILIHDKVKQVRIMDYVIVFPDECDDVVNFVLRFGRYIDCKFSFHENTFPAKLLENLKTCCQRHRTHSLVTSRRRMIHFIDKRSQPAYYLHSILLIFVFVFFLSVMLVLIDYVELTEPNFEIPDIETIIFSRVITVFLIVPVVMTFSLFLYPCYAILTNLIDTPPFDVTILSQ